MKMTAREYARRVRRIGPHSPLGLDCLWAFGVGGGICLLGEVLRQSYLAMGVEADLAGTLTSCSLIVLSAVLTTLGWYQKLAAKAGAGSLVPITGFANAVVSAAIEFRGQDVHHCRAGDRVRHAGGGGVRRGAVGAGHGGCACAVINTGKCAIRLQHDVIIQHFMERFSSIFHEGEILPMTVRCGDTLLFQTLPVIAAGAAVGGKKESEGPLAAEFDELSADNRFGQSSWEAAEKYLQLRAARLCLQKAALPQEKVQLALAGDLQAQCTASSYAMRELGVPFAGLFGACSTMAEGLALGAALCEGGAARNLLAMASSHFCAAERQFRTPLSYGAVRTPTAQWTATAAGCCLLQPQGEGVGIAAATFGRVQDYQVKDINNMGAAMAPAAASTLLHYFKDTGTEPQEFDCIYTGDLGQVGSQLLRELLAAEGLLIKNHVDCGCILFDANEQSVKSGGSGPGCCAAVLCGHILPRLRRGSQKRVLFTATGALMSQTTFLQKETIPAVAHLVELRAPEKEK